MKTKHIDTLHDRVCALCVHLREDTGFLMHLSDVLYGVIELARTGKTIEAMGVAREVASYLAEGHSRSVREARQKAWVDSLRNPSYTPPATYAYTQVKCEPPRPTATVEQMKAAADAAMKNPPAVFECTGCGKCETSTDGYPPLGWVANAMFDGEIYKRLCSSCFGVGIPIDCDYCGATEPGTKDGGWWRFTAKNSITGKYEPRVSCDNCYDSVKDAEDEEP